MDDLESSRELVGRAQKGDAGALNQLLSRYLPRLQRWATRRLPARARDLNDTHDLVQNAVIRSLKSFQVFEYRGEGSFQAYLRKGVLNAIRDEVRRVDRRPQREELSTNVADDRQSPLEAAIGKQALGQYDAALERLSESDREAVILRVEFGYSFREIAEMTDRASDDAARMAVSRALGEIARQMSAQQTAS